MDTIKCLTHHKNDVSFMNYATEHPEIGLKYVWTVTVVAIFAILTTADGVDIIHQSDRRVCVCQG